ncbi:MAG: hypothetical protein WBW78_20900 [Terrimicrobiaceae bacterium]
MRTNFPDGKRLHAVLRQGDFAHAGRRSGYWSLGTHFRGKRQIQLCLDAACGRLQRLPLCSLTGWEVNSYGCFELDMNTRLPLQ